MHATTLWMQKALLEDTAQWEHRAVHGGGSDRMVLQTLSFSRRQSLLSLSFSFRRFISPCKPISGTVTAGQVVGPSLDSGEANHEFFAAHPPPAHRPGETGQDWFFRARPGGRRGAQVILKACYKKVASIEHRMRAVPLARPAAADPGLQGPHSSAALDVVGTTKYSA